MSRPHALVGALTVSRGVEAAGKSRGHKQALGQRMIRRILEPDLIDRERCKRPFDQCRQYLPGEPLRARERFEHNARFGPASNGIDLLNAADSDFPLQGSRRHREKEPLRWMVARQGYCLAKTTGSALRGQLRTDILHRVRVGEQLAKQRLVAFGQRADVKPLCVNVKHGPAVVVEAGHVVSATERSSAARRLRVSTSASNVFAGGSTTVTCMSRSAPGRSPSASRSLRGLCMGSVAA